MRFHLKALAVMTFVLAMTPSAKADILVEPYLGYGIVASTYEYKALPGDVTDAGAGAVFGGRLGYAMPLLWFAADYSMGNFSMKNASKPAAAPASDYDVAATSLYAVVGVKIPLLQAYAGYGFMDQATMKSSTGDNKFTGNAMKFGVGFTGLPIVALNLEYQIHNYNKYTPSSTGTETDVSTTYNKFNNSVIMLSVSAPFRF